MANLFGERTRWGAWTGRGFVLRSVSGVYRHTSGAVVESRSDGTQWAWWLPETAFCETAQWKPTRAEAMAYALGYRIESTGYGYVWRCDGDEDRAGALMTTPEAAARAACEHHARARP